PLGKLLHFAHSVRQLEKAHVCFAAVTESAQDIRNFSCIRRAFALDGLEAPRENDQPAIHRNGHPLFALRYNSSMTVRVELRGDFERNIEDGAGLLLAGKPAWLARYFDGLFPFQIAAGIEGRRGNIILRAAFDAHKLIFAFLEIHKIFAIKYADPCARSPQVLLAPLSMREIENHLPFRGLVAAGKLVG